MQHAEPFEIGDGADRRFNLRPCGGPKPFLKDIEDVGLPRLYPSLFLDLTHDS
jgi:hypothetical protein